MEAAAEDGVGRKQEWSFADAPRLAISQLVSLTCYMENALVH